MAAKPTPDFASLKITRLDSRDPAFSSGLAAAIHFQADEDDRVDAIAAEIIRAIRTEGDDALVALTNRFDRRDVSDVGALRVDPESLAAAWEALEPDAREALSEAADRVRAYHALQRQDDWSMVDGLGNTLGQKVTPLDRIGIYVPGGKAAYPSSVLMNAIPAQVAGVGEIVMVTPAPDGVVNPIVLAAAHLLGVSEIWSIGGAQAIAALAYGTASIRRADKIVGPGNAFVAAAKRRVFGAVGIDMVAGPSEVCVIADDTANPEWIALDLLAQAEHDEDAQSILISPSAAMIDRVEAEIIKHVPQLDRQSIMLASLASRACFIQSTDLAQACEIANRIAPEHLELAFDGAEDHVASIRHAGAIFVGHQASEALGDYCAGPNHVLPTSGSARFSSPLGVYDFQKRSSVLMISKAGARHLGRIADTLATHEHLGAHAAAARMRTTG